MVLNCGTGTTALVRIWDVKSQASVAKFDGHIGPVTAISFSENGYFLASAALDGVKLWDLHKLRNIQTFAPYDSDTPTNSGEWSNANLIDVIRETTTTRMPPNISEVYNINGQPGDLYKCSTKGDANYLWTTPVLLHFLNTNLQLAQQKEGFRPDQAFHHAYNDI